MSKKLTTEEFIEKSKNIHGDKYDYSLVVYYNNSTPVKIIYGGVVYEQLPQNYKDCKNVNYLRFDFYLPDYNILIEYDGRQHFEVVDIWGGEEGLKKTKINDNIKNRYCEKNGIHLLRISHFENVEDELNKYLTMHCI